MAQKPIPELKSAFKNNKTPDENDFSDFMDSYVHKSTKIPYTNIDGLDTIGDYGVLYVDNLQSLYNFDAAMLDKIKVGLYSYVETRGYYTPDDGGGNRYFYQPVITGNDNAGTIIKLPDNSGFMMFDKTEYPVTDFGLFPISNYATADSQKALIERVIKWGVDSQKPIIFPSGNYVTDIFRTGYDLDKKKIHILGRTDVNIYLKYGGTSPVMVQIWDDCTMENMNFISLETDLNWQRAGIESVSNVYLRNCSFTGFLNPTNFNSWGLYLKKASNITIDNCKFGDNSQSDIAIVDGNENVTIINAQNKIKSGVYLNIEPNGDIVNKNISIQGGIFRKMSLLVNSVISNPIQHMICINSYIKELIYDGANVDFQQCMIDKVLNEYSINYLK